MSQPGMCKSCAQGIPLSLIDADGVLTSVSGKPGTVQHHRDDAWWPCEAITYGWKKCPDCEEGTREIETNGPAGTMTMGCETCNQSGFISALAVPRLPPPTGQSLQSIVRSMRREAALWPKTERAQQTARLLHSFADEIEAAAPPTGWQEMATAPKGQKVLVWFTNDSGRNRVTTATFFDAGTLDMDDERDGGIDEDGKNADAGWFEDSEVADPAYFQMQNTPKGWMPLPSAPLAADLEKK